MKKLVLLALTALMMVGCIEHKGTAIKDANNYTWEVVTIDSCEYIVDYGKYSNGTSHKGNCKYCQQRMRQMMWEVQDSILNTMD